MSAQGFEYHLLAEAPNQICERARIRTENQWLKRPLLYH